MTVGHMKRSKASLIRARHQAREAMRHRIILAIRESGMLQTEIVKALGVDKSRVSRWANPDPDQGEIPSEEFLPVLTDILGLNGHWLLTGEGGMWTRARRVAPSDNEDRRSRG